MKWFPIFVIAITLLGLGAFSAALSAGWWIGRSYVVGIVAPPAVSWTVWVPAPDVGIPYAMDGVVQVQGRVESIHGTLLNVTGSGEANIRYTETTFALGTDPFAAPRGFNLSGLEVNQTGPERRFWVWRASSDASANISVNGWAFHEWFHGRTGEPRGMPGQSWNAAAYILAERSLERSLFRGPEAASPPSRRKGEGR